MDEILDAVVAPAAVAVVSVAVAPTAAAAFVAAAARTALTSNNASKIALLRWLANICPCTSIF